MAVSPAKGDVRYEVITQEDKKTGDIIIPLPLPLLKSLGWKEGDDVEISIDETGQLYLKKA
jgi:antitoxin component of MazEF toxin-antitoxin module